ncbi:hypothetical protein HKCCSP123_14380 [Rhodobacterales bacterium HKCCSP123]|nr:hypothetical protein [Rhodobacterales bacterium HKCCSP123]
MKPEDSGGHMALCFVNGSPCPLTVRELVDRIRHRAVAATLIILALLLATSAGNQALGQVPIWARLLLNGFSVAVFLVIFPAFLSEAEKFAALRGWRRVYEPLVTVPTALLVTLASEALAVFLVGDRVLVQRDLALKLAIGVLFWEVVVNILMIYVMPVIVPEAAQAPEWQVANGQVSIGSRLVDPTTVLRAESDDHFMVLHTLSGTSRILCRFRDAEAALEPHGMAVHRSHWVAYSEFGPVARKGRSLIMKTRAGDAVPVARERRAAVEAALEGRRAP